MQAYLPTDTYHHMLDALEAIARTFDPSAPDDLRTRLIMAVGDEGGVWPASCVADNEPRQPVIPDTFIPTEHFHALIERLNAINDPAGEARDKAVHLALVETGRIAPENWRTLYE